MSTISPQKFKDVLVALFKRKGASGKNIALFDEYDHATQIKFLSKVQLLNDESPIIGSKNDVGNWFLVTTDRVLLFSDDKIQEVYNGSIIGVNIPPFHSERKNLMSSIYLKTVGGKIFELQVDAGEPFSGLWNIFRFIVSRNIAAKNDEP